MERIIVHATVKWASLVQAVESSSDSSVGSFVCQVGDLICQNVDTEVRQLLE